MSDQTAALVAAGLAVQLVDHLELVHSRHLVLADLGQAAGRVVADFEAQLADRFASVEALAEELVAERLTEPFARMAIEPAGALLAHRMPEERAADQVESLPVDWLFGVQAAGRVLECLESVLAEKESARRVA